MINIKYILKGVNIFLITILLISTSVIVIANKEIINYKNEDLSKTSGEVLGKFVSFLRGFAVGNATSAKLIGSSGNIAKINFVYLSITRLKFFPPRWETANFFNTTAIIFNINQTIPHGPFDFQEEWVVAIIFKI